MDVRRERGFVLLSGILILLVLAGILGLVTDTATLQCARLRTQTAADAAAIAAWHEMERGNIAGMKPAAEGDVRRNGIEAVRVDVESPPTTGSFAANPGAVAAHVVQENPTYFMRIFGRRAVTVEARAVAIAGSAGQATLGE